MREINLLVKLSLTPLEWALIYSSHLDKSLGVFENVNINQLWWANGLLLEIV